MKVVYPYPGIRSMALFFALTACVDKIDFDVPPAVSQTVIEGMISDEEGPYTIKISKAFNLQADSSYGPPVTQAKITLFDDEGNSDTFIESSPGTYTSGGAIRGRIGHSYHIVVEMPDGVVFQSDPDRINPVGAVERISYEYEARTIHKPYGDLPADVFKIFADASAGDGEERYVRWRFNGMYKVVTQPELHVTWLQGRPLLDPPPCSGYIVAPALGGGRLEKVGECSCCACWISQFESQPIVSDDQLVSAGRFRNIRVGEVPINLFTFFDKYRVEVEQMSLSRTAYEFFKLVRAQKEEASSLFQPGTGEIRGNLHTVAGDGRVVGIFWATSVTRKSLFIPKTAVPYLLPPLDYLQACTALANSISQQPDDWE